MQVGQPFGNPQGRTFSQVIYIGFECKTIAGDSDIPDNLVGIGYQMVRDCLLDLIDDPTWLLVIDFPRCSDQASLFRGLADDKPGVDGDAVSTYSGTGLKNIHARMVIGQVNKFPDINSELVAYHGQLVGIGNIDVAKAVFGKLAHFG